MSNDVAVKALEQNRKQSKPAGASGYRPVNPAIEDIVYGSGEPAIICGRHGRELPSPVPLKHELYILLKYWIRIVIELDFDMYMYEQYSSSYGRDRLYANHRINAICEMFSEDIEELLIEQAYADVERDYAESFFYQALKEGRELLRDERGIPLPAEQQTAVTGEARKNAEEAPGGFVRRADDAADDDEVPF